MRFSMLCVLCLSTFTLANGEETSPPDSKDLDREVAEFVLGLPPSVVEVDVAGTRVEIKSPESLPKESFRLVGMTVGHSSRRQHKRFGEISKRLKDLTNLRSLHVYAYSRTANEDLKNLKGLTSLTDLNLTIQGRGIPSLEPLKGLTNLTHLTVPYLTNEELGHIIGLTNLTHLTVPKGNYTEEGLIQFKKWTKLTHLAAHFRTNEDLRHLQEMTNLTQLTLTLTSPPNGVTNEGLKYLKGLKNLTHLDWMRAYPGGPGLGNLKGLTNLTHLAVNLTEKEELKQLDGLTKLTHLTVRFSQVNDLEHIHVLANLNELTIVPNYHAPTNQAFAYVKGLSNLTHLACEQGTGGPGLEHLKALTNLTHLNVTVSEKNDLSHLKELPNLTHLTARISKDVNDAHLKKLTRSNCQFLCSEILN